MARRYWIWLEGVGYGYKVLDMARRCWIWLEGIGYG